MALSLRNHTWCYWCYTVCEGRANSISSVIIEGGKPGAKVSPCD